MGPLKKTLSLSWPARNNTRATVRLDLTRVSRKRLPTRDLDLVQIGNTTTHPVSTVPLKPAALILIKCSI